MAATICAIMVARATPNTDQSKLITNNRSSPIFITHETSIKYRGVFESPSALNIEATPL